jgi:cytidylate kinase
MTIIAISGKIGSGKDTVAEKIIETFPEFNFQHVKFADNVKKVCAIISGVPLEKFYSRAGKLEYIPKWKMTVGQMQPIIGTDVLRNYFDQEVWVKSLLASHETKNLIISDLRFRNEAAALKQKESLLIRLEGDPANLRTQDPRAINHLSEIDLDDYPHFDLKWENRPPLSRLDILMEQIKDKICT